MSVSSDPLIAAIADFAVFLEFSDDSIVDPDAAVAQMESLAHRLQALSEDERHRVAEEFRNLASMAHDQRRTEFLATLPETFGLE